MIRLRAQITKPAQVTPAVVKYDLRSNIPMCCLSLCYGSRSVHPTRFQHTTNEPCEGGYRAIRVHSPNAGKEQRDNKVCPQRFQGYLRPRISQSAIHHWPHGTNRLISEREAGESKSDSLPHWVSIGLRSLIHRGANLNGTFNTHELLSPYVFYK